MMTDYKTQRPGYDRLVTESNESLACYFGGESLLPHIKPFATTEDASKFEWRKKVTVDNYDNFPEEILETYLEGINSGGEVERKSTDTYFDLFLGNRYEEWVEKEFQPMALLLPEVFVQICIPEHKPNDVRTLEDKQKKNLVPYPVLVFPQFVHSFCQNISGELDWIVIAEGRKFTYWDSLFKADIVEGERVNSSPHHFKSIPFIRIFFKENKAVEGLPKIGRSMMFNVIKKSLGAMTFLSMLHESCHYHLFPHLVMSKDTLDANQKKGGIGAASPILEDPGPQGTTANTRYLQFSADEIKELKDIVFERMPDSIRRVARLRDRSTTKVQSGISKAFDMVPEVNVLSKIASFLQKSEIAIMNKLFKEWNNGLNKEVTCVYPSNFDVKSVGETLKEISDYMSTATTFPKSATGDKILAKRGYFALLPDMSEEERAAITKEIDEHVVKPEVIPAVSIVTDKQFGIGQPGLSG